MSESESTHFRCPRLTDDNWKPWSALVRTYLESKDLLDCITVKPPKSGAANTKHDAAARSIIMMYAGTDRIGYILGLNTAFEQWETLQKIHEPAGQHRLATLLQSFYGYQLRAKPTVDRSASELTSLQSDIRLIDASQAPTDQAKLAMLLLLYRRLNPAYEPVILHIQGLTTLDFANAVAQLKEAERRLLENDSSGPKGADTALAASGKQPKKQQKNQPKGPPPGFKVGECYYCHSTHHKRPECPEYLKTPEGQSRAQNAPKSAPKAAKAAEPAQDKAWTARSATTLTQDLWVVDSGASWHMTGNCKLFSTGFSLFQEPRDVEIADGNLLYGIGQGTIVISLGQREITVSNVLYVPSLATNLLSVSQLEDRDITVSTGGGMLKLHL